MEGVLLDGLYLGFDSSTQSLKATAIDSKLRVVHAETVNFDAAFPQYGTSGGVHCNGLRATAPSAMWIEAFDSILSRLQAASFPFDQVRAISGSGQQHGSVYWRKGARSRLQKLDPTQSLHSQLCAGGPQKAGSESLSAFSLSESPIWMDANTGPQCREIETTMGGALALAKLTGSRAYERFTGPQIRKVWQDSPEVYEDTERISLVSSLGASLLVGDYASIDASDGAGMNLMDLRTKAWSDAALEATAPNLRPRLGEVCPSHSVLGPLHSYYVQRYGFPPTCCVVAWSGDNPCSLAGLALDGPGDVGISLGTSDTVFAVVCDPKPGLEGHVFPNPVDPTSFMAMLCYANGSLTRQAIRDRVSNASWEDFSRLLTNTPPLNDGRIGFFYLVPEIIPPLAPGTHRYTWDPHGGGDARRMPEKEEFDAGGEVRALVEGQLAAMRGHAERIGLSSPPGRVIATGGGSANQAVLRCMAQVFGCAVYTSASTDSAALGAALRAAHGVACQKASRFVTFSDMIAQCSADSQGGGETAVTVRKVEGTGDTEQHQLYGKLVDQRMKIEAQLTSG